MSDQRAGRSGGGASAEQPGATTPGSESTPAAANPSGVAPSSPAATNPPEEAALARPPGLLGRAGQVFTTVVASAWMLFHVWTSWVGTLPQFQQLTLVLGFAFALVFIWYPLKRNPRTGQRPPWAFAVDAAMFGIAMWCAYYIATNFQRLQLTPVYSDYETLLAVGLVVVSLEGTRRVMGPALPLFALAAIGFAYYGGDIFGPFSHSGYSTQRIFAVLSLSRQGIFSVPLSVVGSFLALYMLLAAAMQVSGTGDFFVDMARSLFGRRRGGVAKVALMSSAAYGTISGAGAANVATTGAFTIPMMKRRGYSPTVAAAFEGVASLGGQLMPPVMGAAAFIIASFLGISYGEVILAALLPALFYYWAFFWVVDFEARKVGIEVGGVDAGAQRFRRIMLTHGYHLVPLVVVVYGFLVLNLSPARVGLYAFFSAVIVSWIRPESRIGPRRLVKVFVSGAHMLVQLTMAVATVGVVIGVVSLTGVGLKLSGVLIDLAGGSLFLLLFYTMVASLIIGAGLPTTPTYLILAILVAPALGDAGISLLAAHLFIYYYGVLGDMTPPLAVAPMVAAGIADANPWRTMFTACRVGLAAWLIPFMFAYQEGMLLMGSPLGIAEAILSGIVGLFLLAAAVQRHWLRPLEHYETALAAAGAVVLVYPGVVTDVIGVAVFAFLAVGQFRWRRSERAAASTTA